MRLEAGGQLSAVPCASGLSRLVTVRTDCPDSSVEPMNRTVAEPSFCASTRSGGPGCLCVCLQLLVFLSCPYILPASGILQRWVV